MGLLAVKVSKDLMANRHAHIPVQQLEVPLATELIDAINSARQLPHTIVKEKHLGYAFSRAISVGKPWYDYENFTNDYTEHKERRRLRVVERWFDGNTLHGVISVSMQYVYSPSFAVDKPTVEELSINDAMFSNKKSIALVEQNSKESHLARLFKMAFLANGSVVGKLVLRTGNESPYTGGFVDSCEQAAEDFYLEQPFLEEDYKYSSADDVTLGYVVHEVVDFVKEETQLAKLRMALGYSNA
ncbi:hypothetical protein EB118_01345 [bacterium]|nr:hypothetical protein [bacterium]NDG28734.1 hypothetical protein [bacterium]